jgi:hypothetical protein
MERNASTVKNGCGSPHKAVAAAARLCGFEEPKGGFDLQKKTYSIARRQHDNLKFMQGNQIIFFRRCFTACGKEMIFFFQLKKKNLPYLRASNKEKFFD